jgi:putative hydrolase of the HAD superfamily
VKIRPAEAGWAIGAEIAFYRAHLSHARDLDALADLRARCTEVLRSALPAHARDVPDLQGALLAALRFRPYPEVPETLRAWRERGLKLVVVSNWDVSLHEVLDRTELTPLLDGAISSAEHGAAKPDPSIFAAGLELAGVPAAEALHVGDSVEADVDGARAAGLEAVLVVRDGAAAPPGVRAVPSLDAVQVP